MIERRRYGMDAARSKLSTRRGEQMWSLANSPRIVASTNNISTGAAVERNHHKWIDESRWRLEEEIVPREPKPLQSLRDWL